MWKQFNPHLETQNRLLENSADPDQTLQNAAFDQGSHCLHSSVIFR